MALAGSVNDSSLSSPRTPNAPWTLPSRMRRTEGSMSAVAAPGAAGASGGGSRRGSRVGLGRFPVPVEDLVGQLRALPDPVVDPGDFPPELGRAPCRERRGKY